MATSSLPSRHQGFGLFDNNEDSYLVEADSAFGAGGDAQVTSSLTSRRQDFGLLDKDEDGNLVEPDLVVGTVEVTQYQFWMDLDGLHYEVDGVSARYFLFVDIQLHDYNLKLVFGDQLGEMVYLASAIQEDDTEPTYHLMLDAHVFKQWLLPIDGASPVIPAAGQWCLANPYDFLKDCCIYSPEMPQLPLIRGDTDDAFAAAWEGVYTVFVEHLSGLKLGDDKDHKHLFGGVNVGGSPDREKVANSPVAAGRQVEVIELDQGA